MIINSIVCSAHEILVDIPNILSEIQSHLISESEKMIKLNEIITIEDVNHFTVVNIDDLFEYTFIYIYQGLF